MVATAHFLVHLARDGLVGSAACIATGYAEGVLGGDVETRSGHLGYLFADLSARHDFPLAVIGDENRLEYGIQVVQEHFVDVSHNIKNAFPRCKITAKSKGIIKNKDFSYHRIAGCTIYAFCCAVYAPMNAPKIAIFGVKFIHMEDEVKITEMTVEQPVGEPTARQELETLLNEILPEEKRTGDVDQMALDFIKEQLESNNRIAEAIAEDERLAQAFADVAAGTRKPAAAIARYFGKRFSTAEEGTPEYDEVMAADEEYFNEREKMKADREKQAVGASEFFDAFENYLEAQGLDKEKYVDAVFKEVLEPALDLRVDETLFARLVNAVDYNKDVEDAFKAGEVKGRNTNIHEMKGKIGDGLPKAMGSQGVQKPKRPMNSLLAKALNA